MQVSDGLPEDAVGEERLVGEKLRASDERPFVGAAQRGALIDERHGRRSGDSQSEADAEGCSDREAGSSAAKLAEKQCQRARSQDGNEDDVLGAVEKLVAARSLMPFALDHPCLRCHGRKG